MGFSTEEISAVRALPVVQAVGADGRWQAEGGFVEVVFESSAVGKHHQVYVDGRLAGVTLSTDDRRVIGAAPETAASAIEVVAVDADDRLTDFSASLEGYADGQGSRVEVAWSGGRYLDDNLDHFDVYGGPEGAIDHARPLNAEPIAALVNGQNLGGFGRGGFGRGGFGRSAMRFFFATTKYFAGRYAFEVAALDAAGNTTSALQVIVEVNGLLRPPEDLSVTEYQEQTQTAHLEWSASPDLPA